MSTTTYKQRFTHAIAILCNVSSIGRYHLDNLIDDYLNDINDSLLHFCMKEGPHWSQGSAILDAAHILAENPLDGVGHTN